MISSDQPTIFDNKIIAAVSSIKDGNMKKYNMPETVTKNADANRIAFLAHLDIQIEQSVLVNMSYDRDDFTRYTTVEPSDCGGGMVDDKRIVVSDALMTTQPDTALFLPLADCVGAILYDPQKKVLMVSHLGRHNIEQNGAYESVQYMKENANIKPSNLQVWLSPSAGGKNYPLHAFDNKSQQQVAMEQLLEAGVTPGNIEASPVDTTLDKNYFSHSEFLKDDSQPQGRFAIVAMIK